MGENVSQRDSWFVPSSINPLFLSRLPRAADLAVAVFLTFTCVMSFLGNGMSLLIYCRKRKKLRPPELMTINLALLDLGFSLLGGPFFIISSLCHAWVFGETGCLWYGIQGFVFGIGSLLTTCLISLDRCLKICCLRYGQWIERRHGFLSIALVWVYTLFWALLPLFGFGSYGPEPYGTSCTINWWGMRSSLNDRIYIFLVLVLCFGVPTLAILASYLAILLRVYRSNRILASIPSSSVSHTSKDLRLAKMAAVVCISFLVAWTPYATVSLISALIPRDDQEASLQTVVEESTGGASNSPDAPNILDISSLLNWTAREYYRGIYYTPDDKWNDVNNMNSVAITSDPMFRSKLDKEVELETRSPQPMSCLSPLVTLIPAMFAKSHCMMNPFIYQIMNREFRDDVYEMVFGQEKAERRRMQGRKESLGERSMSISYCQSWRRKRSDPVSLSVERKKSYKKKRGSSSGEIGGDNISVGAVALDFYSSDTQGNMERHCSINGWTRRNLRGSTSSTDIKT
ncbi:opsin 9 [Centropristis striata]|uniref:opsin 9 n=1 Tax=Centropristis striata TaxID=184440 RepID=UPI0027E03550|nr:opsin 9 [Centropristis striata]